MTKVEDYLKLIYEMDDVFKLAPEHHRTLHPSDEIPVTVPTLKRGVERPVTPQLAARFSYCGTWEGAVLGETWLGLHAMRRLWRDGEARKQIAERREHWSHTAVARRPLDQLSVFGIDTVERNESYLVWPMDDGPEPAVVHFLGHDQKEFGDLEAYLDYLVHGAG